MSQGGRNDTSTNTSTSTGAIPDRPTDSTIYRNRNDSTRSDTMRRYNNSYRIICSNIAIGTIDKQQYELLRAAKRHFPLLRVTFHGNGVVKTVTVESYELYKQVRNDYNIRTQA